MEPAGRFPSRPPSNASIRTVFSSPAASRTLSSVMNRIPFSKSSEVLSSTPADAGVLRSQVLRMTTSPMASAGSVRTSPVAGMTA